MPVDTLVNPLRRRGNPLPAAFHGTIDQLLDDRVLRHGPRLTTQKWTLRNGL
jgi:hypothetical protein